MGRFFLLGAFLLTVVFLSRGNKGVRELLQPMLVWRISLVWFLFAAVWAVVICVAVLVGKGILTGAGLSTLQVNFDLVSRPSVIKTILISSLIGEIVWIGYSLNKLSAYFTPFISALVVGAFWTAWWMPMVFFRVGVIPDLPLIGLLFNQTGVAVMCAFFYSRTRSGLVVLVMQIAFNSAILMFPVAPSSGGVSTYWVFAIAYFLAAFSVFAIFGPKPILYKRLEYSGF